MKLPRKQAAVVQEAIARWKQDGVIPDAQAATLAGTIEVQYFDWRKLAKYSFWIALFSIISSVSAALSDRMLQRFARSYLQRPSPCLNARSWHVIAAGLYRLGPASGSRLRIVSIATKRSSFSACWRPPEPYPNSGRRSIRAAATIRCCSALVSRLRSPWLLLESNLIWVFALASLGGWMGTETGYMSGWGAYYLGMNYPLRFVLFGAATDRMRTGHGASSGGKQDFTTARWSWAYSTSSLHYGSCRYSATMATCTPGNG